MSSRATVGHNGNERYTSLDMPNGQHCGAKGRS